MAGFRELQYWLKSRLFPGQADGNRRPDGGTSCYRPIQRKNPEENQNFNPGDGAAQAAQTPVAHTGFTDMNPPATGMYREPGMSGDPYGYGAAQQAQQEYRASFAASGESAPAGGNISYMPGAFAPGSGNSYTHVEHIMAITSLSACYEAIECMKNGETVLCTMDTIANESESIRCQDMLAGAAFTLGCTVRMLQAGDVVLIASAGVKVLPEQQARNWSMPEPAPARPAPAPREQQRNRRMSQNAVGWKNAFSKENREYNPYTGSMPAAAGDYDSYGGYGSTRSAGTEYSAYGNGTYGQAGPGDGYQTGYARNGYGDGYAQTGYAQGGYEQTGYAQNGYAQTGYAGAGYGDNYGQTGYAQNGYAQTGYAGNGGYQENTGYMGDGYGGAGYMNASGTGYDSRTGYASPAPNAGYGY